MPTKSAWIVTVLAALAAPVRAEPPDPRALLEKAQAALRELPAVCYEARSEAEGVLAMQTPRMAGTITLVRVPGSEIPRVRIDVRVTLPNQGQPFQLQLANDGKTVTLVDHARQTYIQRDLPGGAALLNAFSAVLIRDLTAERPLENESKAVSLTHVGEGSVGTVECDVIQARLAAEGGETQWYFAKSDHLPRRVQRFIETPMGRASLSTIVVALETQPTIEDALFRLEKPDGYAGMPEAPPGAGTSLLAVGSAAPDWTLKNAEGQEVTLKSLRGKTVLLDFWATWCGPCKKAMPDVQKVHTKYKDKPVAVYGVNCWERDPRANPVEFVKNAGYTYPQLLNGGEVAQKYGVRGIPTFYVIGPDGKVLFAGSGMSPESMRHVESLIDKALATNAGPPTSQPESAPATPSSAPAR